MQELTNSRRRSFQDCPRKHYYAYELCRRPLIDSDALRFGTLWHGVLERYMRGEDAFAWLADQTEKSDPFHVAIASALFVGYIQRWGEPDSDWVTEIPYKIPLRNPAYEHSVSRTWMLSGKVDASKPSKIMEHKTTSESILPESDYWDSLVIDSQVIGYMVATGAMECIYDVVKKPTLKPLKATPEDKRQYTKKTKELYANQRENDETAQEYYERILVDITENPDKYYARKTVYWTEDSEREYYQDAWNVSRMIRECQLSKCWPRNTTACKKYGKCEYFNVCAGRANIEDPTLFRTTVVNPELLEEPCN